MARSLATFAFATLLLAPVPVLAAPPKIEKLDRTTLRFDVMAGVGWYNDVGPGFRVEVPLIRDLAHGVPNELYLSMGAELRWFYHPLYDGFGGYPVMAGQWAFHINNRWAVFPELGLCGIFAPHRARFWEPVIAPYAAGGARYYFGPRTAIVFRMSWPVGVQVGISF